MVTFQDPTVLARDALVLVKLWHTFCGLYIWEFITTLGYEWSVIRGRRPYRWTIWVYALARVATLVAVLLGFPFMDDRTQLNCQLLSSIALTSSFFSVAASSLLIVLRIIAIWKRNKVIMATAIGIWGINILFLIQGIARLRFTWVFERVACESVNPRSSTLTLVSILVTDFALLLIMLFGLLRLRGHGGGTLGLTRLLWTQGVIWLLIATAADVPPVVLVILDLNDSFNMMFQIPSWIIMSITATRIHRALIDFTSRPANVTQENHQRSVPKFSAVNPICAPPSPHNRMEVAVHTTFEQYPAPQTCDSDSSSSSTVEQVLEKRTASGLSANDDIERGMWI